MRHSLGMKEETSKKATISYSRQKEHHSENFYFQNANVKLTRGFHSNPNKDSTSG